MTAEERTAQKIINIYTAAQTELIDIVNKLDPKRSGNVTAQKNQLLKQVTATLDQLKADTNNAIKTAVNGTYEQAMKDTAEMLGDLGAEINTAFNVTDTESVKVIINNATNELNSAVEMVGRRFKDQIRQAAVDATAKKLLSGQTITAMRDQLAQELAETGLSAFSYVRNGKVVNMRLKSYADMVARTTVRETTNTARINLGKKIDNDLVKMTSHAGACPICVPLEGRIYSVSGKDKRYPALYETAFISGYNTVHPNCGHTFNVYIEKYDDDAQTNREYSNRSFEVGGDGWTADQVKKANADLDRYNADQAVKRARYNDRMQYERYKAKLGDQAPKTFSGFRAMKKANSDSYKDLKANYRTANKE